VKVWRKTKHADPNSSPSPSLARYLLKCLEEVFSEVRAGRRQLASCSSGGKG
jgi:hypothetical protein